MGPPVNSRFFALIGELLRQVRPQDTRLSKFFKKFTRIIKKILVYINPPD